MASLFSASLNSTSDLSKPETDLAEWTSKIKALQKQVDADEEAEQKRLEDEIVAARLARLRRRSGMDTESRFNTMDISNNKEDLNLPTSAKDNVLNRFDKSGAEQQIDRNTALRRLMSTNDVYNPDKISTPVRAATEKVGSTSLAAFIGGRASGPRLNRHAPQQDAHDLTQFVQPDTSHPHPIFGRGGIAMPGMADKKGSYVHGSSAGSESSERYRPSLTAKPKSPSSSTVSSKTETSNLSSVDISRRSIGPSRVAERYGAKVEESPIDLDTEIPQPSRPSFRTTKSTSSTPLTKKDTGQNQEPYFRSSNFPNNFADRSLSSNISNFTSESPPVSTVFSSTGLSKVGSSNKPDSYISTIPVTPKSTPPFVGAPTSDNPRTIRTDSPERARDTPLRKLMETNNVHNPDKTTTQASQKLEASSLAAFIGGRATGPRLNRHAPQQDVHDPTQFVQPDLSIPHPIFGKGGIAMPGMVTKRSSPHDKMVDVESKSKSPPGHDEKASSQKRMTSASSSKDLESISTSRSARGGTSNFASSPSVNRSSSPTKEFGARTSTRDRTISTPSYSHSVRTSHELSRSSMSPTPSRSSNSTLSLAQPIRPDIKVPTTLPQITSTIMPSPAFQKPLSQKDPTPSISRLQGRGFVQSMVKVSAELETSSPTTPSPGIPRPASGRKNAVLDRWQPTQADTSPTRPAPSYPDVMRRLTTFNTTNITSDNLDVSTHATGMSRTLKSVASLPSLSKAATPGEIDPANPEPTKVDESLVHDKPPGLGSASTMVVIKPSKSSGDFSQKLRLDELGMKNDPTNFFRQDKGSHFIPHSEKATSSRKPLIHPTKDRARKPKKSKDAIDAMKDLLPAVDARCPGPAETDFSVVVKTESVVTVNSVALQAGNGKSLPSAALADHSEVSSVSNKRDDLPSISRTSAPSLTQHAESEIPQHNASYHLRLPCSMPPSEDNAPEVEYLQNDSFINPHPSFTPPLESPSSSMLLPVNAVKVPVSPRRHSRIPSTGSRITVMEVSQSLNDAANSRNPLESCASPIDSAHEPVSPVEFTSNSRTTLSQSQAEKRKSSYDKYSAIILPPLKEEATPIQTPTGTFTRINANQRRPSIEVARQGDANSGNVNRERSNDDNMSLVAAKTKDMVYLDHSDEAIPQVDLTSILKTRSQPFRPSPDIQTVSIEVLAITGTTATPVLRDINVFYDSEILAIIHRTKSKLSGLASTSVWCWLGKQTILGDREDRKLQELATRYGTTRAIVYQLAEPCELIHILGGRLAIRQGTRTHWTPENTTMHLVRSLNNVILIDEHDLSIKNLCSAFSYCVTILDSVYVWYGRGSILLERKAALQYAEAMTKGSPPIELYEGENDNDEMFWIILGDDGFAQADYWRWRKTFANIEPSIWKVDSGSGASFMRPVEFVSLEQDHHTSVYLIDCVWEFFILVCDDARSNRRAIRLALDIAKKLSKEVASTRPYPPTVHTLILPSQIPLDLLLNIRDLNEAWLNRGNIPDHMNLLPSSEAIDHLSKYVWERAALKDHDMLPLGVGVSDAMRLPQVCL